MTIHPISRMAVLAALTVQLLLSPPAIATELVYRPVNPSFGCDPLNGSTLINGANAQNHYQAPSRGLDGVSASTSSLQQFTSMLQQAILSRIAGAVSSSVVDAHGNLIPGTVTVGNMSVTVLDLGTTLRITTVDATSGQSSVFEVPK